MSELLNSLLQSVNSGTPGDQWRANETLFPGLLKRDNQDIIKTLKSKLVQMVLTNQDISKIFQDRMVAAWIYSMVINENIEALQTLVDMGYVPSNTSDFWTLMQHPSVAAMLVNRTEDAKCAIGAQLNPNVPEHRTVIEALLGKTYTPENKDEIDAQLIKWRHKHCPWLAGGKIPNKNNGPA